MSVLQPVLRPVLQPLSLSLTRAGVPIWTPRRLFAAGEQGVWYDPSDLSTLFQDAAGTTPVTAVGQPVGLMKDKSGRGNHASQSTTTARPTLQQDSGGRYYLQGDGVDDLLACATFPAIGGLARTAMLAGRADTIGPSVFSQSYVALGSSNGAMGLYQCTPSGTLHFSGKSSGTGSSAQSAGNTDVMAYSVSAVGAVRIRKDMGAVESDTASGVNTVAGLNLLATNSVGQFLQGRLYGAVIVAADLSSGTLDKLRRYLASKSGVTL